MNALYPGENANPNDLLRLAHEYRVATDHLYAQRRKGEPISLAACRLTAIHAIELYLNSHLGASGLAMKQVRALGHDLAERAKLAAETGLVLRKLTTSHLAELTGSREYLEARYDPGMTKTQMNRLMASLAEVAAKVAAAAGAGNTGAMARSTPSVTPSVVEAPPARSAA